MIDVSLPWGADLAISPSGDIALTSATTTISQRVGRRLLTTAGDYIWQLDYGASLGSFVGLPADLSGIEAIIRSQVVLEPAVPAFPAPDVIIDLQDRAAGIVTARITYADLSSNNPAVVDVSVPLGTAS